jgi:hypothetical protein
VNPGSVGTAQTIQEPLLDLGAVKYNNGTTTTTQTPAHVVLTYSDGTCTDQWRPPLLSTMNPTNGWLKNPGQPYAPSGTLTVCADYNPGSGTYYKASSPPMGNTNFSAANVVPTITITKATANQGTC